VASSPGTRLAPDARRDQLIRLGVELLGEHAYDQVSITELARAAGISKGLLYHYFPTKSEFVVAVLRQSREQLEQRMAVDMPSDPVERLDANLDAYLTLVEQHAAGYQALARARHGEDNAIRAELVEGRRQRISMLIDFAAALAEAEREDLEGPALETVLGGWLSFSEDVVVRWLAQREFSRDQVRQLLRQAFFASLASVVQIDDSAAARRLAEAAARAAAPAALTSTS
jgi:AcrR family transcriptional regulator